MEERYVYKDLNEVPVVWRVYKGARLNLEQVNQLMEYAYANPVASGDSMIPDYGGAKAKFEEDHKIENNFWVIKSGEDR